MADQQVHRPGALSGRRVLIVEDEPFIAMDLAFAVEAASGVPVGPVGTVAEAIKLLESEPVAAAILDINLPDGHVGPVLQALESCAAVVVHSGYQLPPDVRARFPSVPVFAKPTMPEVLIARLAADLVGRAPR